MKKLLQNLLYISFLINIFCNAYAVDVSLGYLHPQISGIGNAGIAYNKNPNASILNPAILAHYNGWSFYSYTASFENEINNTHINFKHSLWDTTFSHSFYSQELNGIPITRYIDYRIRKNGEFSANIAQYKLGLGKKINDFFLFKDLDIGASFALQKYSFDEQTYFYQSYGMLASTYLWDHIYFGSVLDIHNTDINLNYGLSYMQTDYSLFLDYQHKDLKAGIDYKMHKYLHLRTGIEPRYYTLGLGLFYDNLYGPLNINLALQIDYTYMIPMDDMIYSPNSYFSFTIRELEQLSQPLIYRYPSFTNQRNVLIDGWAPRNATIWIYVNDEIVGKTQSNSNGQWETMIPLDLQINTVKAKTVRLMDQKSSAFSKKVQIVIDDTPPSFYLSGIVSKDLIELVLAPNEQLSKEPLIELENKKHIQIPLFMKKYQLRTQKSNFSNKLSISITDLAGNTKTENFDYPLINFKMPEQKLIMTYKDKYLFKGSSYRKYAKIKSFNSKTNIARFITIEKNGSFSHILKLAYGLNAILFEEFHDNGELKYPFKIVRLFHFNDIDNVEYDKLATIGIIKKSKHFQPNKRVYQKSIIEWLIKYKEINLDLSSEDNWLNLAYQYALDNKWINNRDDTRLVTRIQAMDIISTALPFEIHNTQKEESYFKNIKLNHPYLKTINYFVEHGLISKKRSHYAINSFITKDEFCNWLIRTPQKNILINHFLMND